MSEARAAVSQKRVLVVDDEPRVGAILRRLLRREGLQVTVVGSAEEALSQLDALQPNLVVTDYRMTGMDGVQLLIQVARRRPGTPGIVVSGHNEADLMRGLDAWQFAYLQKPWSDVELLATVRRLLGL